jgi:hypothetical protein
MTITTEHPRSSYGIPVILDDRGRVMDYAPGLRAVMERLGWDRPTLAKRCNVSIRTVEGWFQGRMPETAALNVLADALREQEKELRKKA